MIDLKKDNNHLNETLDNIKYQLLNSNKECENLRIENKLADDNHIRKSIDLENIKQNTSEITLN